LAATVAAEIFWYFGEERVMAFLGVQTYPGWLMVIFAIITMAWGTFLVLNPVALIELLHRGEENSPITRSYLNLPWNRWMSIPFWVRTSGVFMVGIGLALLALGVFQ
jgi:hypothetical protein